MRRVFLHVDEFGKTGMVYLPHLACLSDPLVVWGPSARLLQNTPTFLTPHDLRWLVDQPDAPVRIIGRESWLLDKQFRNTHPWPGAGWVEEFDGAIKEFAIDDSSKPLPSRRVIIAEPEEGFDKADEVLKSDIGRSVGRRLRRLYAEKALPEGILEKAQRAKDKRLSVPRAILRDVYNHSRAMASAGAQIAATPSEHMDVLQSIVPDPVITGVTSLEPGKGYVTSADVREAVQVVSRVKPVMTMRGLRRFLKSGFKTELHNLMYSPRSLPRLDLHLIKEVKDAIIVEPLFKRLFPLNDPITFSLSVGGLVSLLTSLLLTEQLQWGLIPVAVEAIRSPLRKYSYIPEAARPGHRARALFYLINTDFIFGTDRLTRRQIQDLLYKLSQARTHEEQGNY